MTLCRRLARRSTQSRSVPLPTRPSTSSGWLGSQSAGGCDHIACDIFLRLNSHICPESGRAENPVCNACTSTKALKPLNFSPGTRHETLCGQFQQGAGRGGRPLSEHSSARLAVLLADQEIFVEIQENVRGEEVFVLQSTFT